MPVISIGFNHSTEVCSEPLPSSSKVSKYLEIQFSVSIYIKSSPKLGVLTLVDIVAAG